MDGPHRPGGGRDASPSGTEPPVAPVAAGERAPRVAAVDIARALAVTGVVFNHAVDGLIGAQMLDPASRIAGVNSVLYVFRMPALALLLGLFIPRGCERRGARAYLRDRIGTVLYLYLVWFYLQSAIEIAASGVKNRARQPAELLTPWITFGQLWFLPFLAAATLVVVALRPWRSRTTAFASSLLALGVALFAWGWTTRIAGLDGAALMLFTTAGAALGLPRVGRWLQAPVRLWVPLGLVGAAGTVVLSRVGAVPATGGEELVPPATAALSIAAAACGVVALLAAAAVLARLRGVVVRALVTIGSHTLAIFLAHVTVVAGTRIVAAGAGVADPLVILALAVPLGVVVPVAVSRYSTTRPWRWLFEAPRWVRGR